MIGLRRFVGTQRPHACGTEQGAGWYDSAYDELEAYRVPYAQSCYYFMWAVICDRLRRHKVSRVLEVGCGPGQFAALLYDQGITSYIGFDFSERAVEMAATLVPRGKFLVGNALDPSMYKWSDYDAIVCTEVLEHIQDDLGVVSLFPQGKRCVCSVPNFPYVSHVRHFLNEQMVSDRYARYFSEFDVVGLKGPRGSSEVFYVFEGVRR